MMIQLAATPGTLFRPWRSSSQAAPEPSHLAPGALTDTAKFKQSILRHLTYTLARDQGSATPRDWWIATASAVREQVLARLLATQAVHNKENVRRLYYLSLEYLMGRLMENNLQNTGLTEAARTALAELGVRPETATLVRDLAHLEAFMLGRTAPAIDRLTALLAERIGSAAAITGLAGPPRRSRLALSHLALSH
jgi:hypothetical protein